MFLRFRRDRPTSRGQALVETALILPILALVLVMAVDFGRVFFGWVALQSAARVGADYASTWSCAWANTCAEGPQKKDRYVELIEADIRTINCALAGGTPPDPEFVDSIDTPVAPAADTEFNDGDYAVVELECSFDLFTPIAEAIFGGSVAMIAHEEYPIHRQIVQALPSPTALPGCPAGQKEVPDMFGEGQTMGTARDLWVAAGFAQANFTPAVVSTGPPGGRNVNKITTGQSLPKNVCTPITATVVMTHLP